MNGCSLFCTQKKKPAPAGEDEGWMIPDMRYSVFVHGHAFCGRKGKETSPRWSGINSEKQQVLIMEPVLNFGLKINVND